MELSCCNDQQYLSICLIVLYAALILLLWRLSILHPFKILAVFLHELGHAIACWLTCGKVEGMEVHPNEGGTTKTSGGVPWIILSAGYLGSAIWGMALITASGNKLSSEIAAGVLIHFLAVFIFFGTNSYLRILNASFVAFLACLMAINLWSPYEPLRYVTLFMGVMSCLFSIYDIWDDLLARRINERLAFDATVLAEMTHTSSRCWGIIWGIIALVALVAAVYLHLIIEEEDGESVSSIMDTSTITQVVFFVTIAVLCICVIHAAITKRVMMKKRDFGSRDRDANASYVCVTDDGVAPTVAGHGQPLSPVPESTAETTGHPEQADPPVVVVVPHTPTSVRPVPTPVQGPTPAHAATVAQPSPA